MKKSALLICKVRTKQKSELKWSNWTKNCFLVRRFGTIRGESIKIEIISEPVCHLFNVLQSFTRTRQMLRRSPNREKRYEWVDRRVAICCAHFGKRGHMPLAGQSSAQGATREGCTLERTIAVQVLSQWGKTEHLRPNEAVTHSAVVA